MHSDSTWKASIKQDVHSNYEIIKKDMTVSISYIRSQYYAENFVLPVSSL